MSGPEDADARTKLLLRAIHPLVPGAATGDVRLEAVEPRPEARLRFRGPDGLAFVVRLHASQPGARAFARAGRVDLLLDTDSPPPRSVERFVRSLAVVVARNLEGASGDELRGLAADDGAAPGGDVPPALRRRMALGAESLLDVNVGDGCNLDCTFCTDVDARGRDLFRPLAFWREELARARAAGKTGLLISGNEPTLRPDLPALVATARDLGFAEVELSTAGVRLAERAYLDELLDAGVNVLAVSIHGSNAAVDGAQTGRPDFFEPRRRGFEHFVARVGDRAAQERAGVFLKTITILTRSNLADLPALVALLDAHAVSYALLHYPWVKGAAATRFDEVVPDYAAVREALQPLEARLRARASTVAVANLPTCVLPGLHAGRTSRKDLVRPASSGDPLGRGVLRVVSAMDPTLAHAPCCAACTERDSCQGAPRAVLDRFGEAGLRALV